MVHLNCGLFVWWLGWALLALYLLLCSWPLDLKPDSWSQFLGLVQWAWSQVMAMCCVICTYIHSSGHLEHVLGPHLWFSVLALFPVAKTLPFLQAVASLCHILKPMPWDSIKQMSWSKIRVFWADSCSWGWLGHWLRNAFLWQGHLLLYCIDLVYS